MSCAYNIESKLEERKVINIKKYRKDQDKILVGLQLLFFHC